MATFEATDQGNSPNKFLKKIQKLKIREGPEFRLLSCSDDDVKTICTDMKKLNNLQLKLKTIHKCFSLPL